MYKSSIFKTSVAFAAILSSQVTFSAEDEKNSETGNDFETNNNTVVITANRVEQNINDILAVVEVFTREDIEKIQPESITDLLESVAGMDVVHNGGAGQSSALYTRGTNSDHTLVLIDGVRVGSATLGTKGFSSIPVAQIERIEIVKGPRAALWGSDAIGGVIQIFTRSLKTGELSSSLTLGSNNYASADLSAGFGDDKISNTVTLSFEQSDGFDAFDNSTDTTEDTQLDADGYERLSAALRGDYELSKEIQLDWVAQFDRGNSEFDSLGSDETDYNNHLWNIRYTYTIDDLVAQFSVKQSRDQSISFGNDNSKTESSVFETRREQANGLVQYQISDEFSLTGGIDHLIDDVAHSKVVGFDGTASNYEDQERTTKSAYISSLFKLAGFTGELTGRHDDVEGVKGYGTFNASLGYAINNHVMVSANRSKGFKAPTFNDLYYPNFNNPKLKSETSYNTEFLVKANWQNHSFILAHYDNQVDQLITYNPDSFKSENIADADISGLEFIYQLRHGSLTHKFSATNLDPIDNSIDAATGERGNTQLLRRAKELYSYELTADIGDFSIFTQVNYTGSRFDKVFGSPRERLDSYLRLNLGATYNLSDEWNLKLKVSDATEAEPQSIIAYNNAGRQVFLTIQYLNF